MKKVWLVCLAVLLLAGCNWFSKNKKDVDVSAMQAPVQILRFDRDMNAIKPDNIDNMQKDLRSKYGSFYDTYVYKFILGGNVPRDSVQIVWKDALLEFSADYYVNKLQGQVSTQYKSTDDVQKDIEEGFKHVKHYFPSAALPNKAYAVNSVFGMYTSILYDSTTLIIPLDNYLGANNSYYDSVEGIPQYLRTEMSREYIGRDCLLAYFDAYLGIDYINSNLPVIEAMVEAGKRQYYLELMMPHAPDSMLMGWTQKQTDWCKNSEASIWKFYNEQDILYKNNFQDKKRNLDKGPTTTGMPPESPGNIGTWIGWQIVRSFMANTGEKVTLKDLITNFSPQQIIAKAKYKPKA